MDVIELVPREGFHDEVKNVGAVAAEHPVELFEVHLVGGTVLSCYRTDILLYEIRFGLVLLQVIVLEAHCRIVLYCLEGLVVDG